MALPSFTTKVVGSDTVAERQVLYTDINQIKQALQTGALDIKPLDAKLSGTNLYFNDDTVGIRYNTGTNKVQVSHDGSTWADIGASTELITTVTAGEDLAIRDLVYFNSSDGKVYKCDADDQVDWVGVMSEAVLTDATGSMYTNGAAVGGFTGLTAGAEYYVSSTAGEVSATGVFKVGLALSTTVLKLIKQEPMDFSIPLLNTLNHLRDSPGSDVRYENYFYDILTDSSKIDAYSNVGLAGSDALGSELWVQLNPQDTTPYEDADFTGASMDADWTLSASGTSTSCSFDATNDEIDCAVNHTSAGAFAKVEYTGTMYDDGIFLVKLRNMVQHGSGGVVGKISFYYGGLPIYYVFTNVSGWLNNTGAASSGTSVGLLTDLSIKLIRRGNRADVYYDTGGGAPATLLYKNVTLTETSTKPYVQGSFNTSGASTTHTYSVYDLKLYKDYETSGNFTTTTDTIDSSQIIETDFCDVTNTTNTSVSCEISHDNGSNYDSLVYVNNSGRKVISNSGTTLKKKYTLTTSDSTETPKIYGHVNTYF